MGKMYASGYGVRPDYALAMSWYRKSAEQGDAKAQNNLGRMYENGHGVRQDDAEAVSWYQKSANQGYAKALNNLGKMYENGRGVEQDYGEAMSRYRRSAEQGNADAQYNVGAMYEQGQDVHKDVQQAALWYRKAADLLHVGTLLGLGGYGNVYRAEWGGRVVAAKKLHVTAAEAANNSSIQREIQLLEKLQSKHIIQFYGTINHEDRLVIMMEFAEGGCLNHAINDRLLDWPNKTRIAEEIARGLAYIHQMGVIHRDLKSMNVLLSRQKEAKLCDFGMATVKSQSDPTSTALPGTIRWMAPELFNPPRIHSTKSDMYAFGLVMWEMAANRTIPFPLQGDAEAVFWLVFKGAREELPEDTPSGYRRWIEQCWYQEPERRPEASALIERIDELKKTN
ncbi:hypothetical protein DFQ27_002023 [Actinomortierella ambigua]|uniref:Protein kinase domain-containing protein n=1 Tax=Actinomortierella ambigua TaxID=1343610 RepID=A0A9P6QBF3_9FUNG|nr:hypothetical protein DFQ27_002023 [Actinomortierella ambigua]